MGVYLLVINYLSNDLTVRDASDLRMVGGGGGGMHTMELLWVDVCLQGLQIPRGWGVLNYKCNVYTGKLCPRSNPLPFYNHTIFHKKGTPFIYLLLSNGTPFTFIITLFRTLHPF